MCVGKYKQYKETMREKKGHPMLSTFDTFFFVLLFCWMLHNFYFIPFNLHNFPTQKKIRNLCGG